MEPSPVVYLAPLVFYEEELLNALSGLIRGTFGTRVERLQLKIDLAAAYSTTRNQYSADKVMKTLLEVAPDTGKLLAVLDVDIFVPIFTFIFGEAQLNGHVALVSTWRLRPETQGGPPDRGLFMERVFKESIHELGHAFGLKHCYNPGCVMNFSPTVEHVDEKNFGFCAHCERMLRRGA